MRSSRMVTTVVALGALAACTPGADRGAARPATPHTSMPAADAAASQTPTPTPTPTPSPSPTPGGNTMPPVLGNTTAVAFFVPPGWRLYHVAEEDRTSDGSGLVRYSRATVLPVKPRGIREVELHVYDWDTESLATLDTHPPIHEARVIEGTRVDRVPDLVYYAGGLFTPEYAASFTVGTRRVHVVVHEGYDSQLLATLVAGQRKLLVGGRATSA